MDYRSNIHVNIDYWSSLNPKKATLPSYLRQTSCLLVIKQNTITSNLQFNNFPKVLAAKCSPYLARPHPDFICAAISYVLGTPGDNGQGI